MTPAGRLVVLDFGIVSELDQPGEPGSGPGSRTFGTVQYMAPEQAAGDVTAAADWYSVGVLLYQTLTGRLPFVGSPERILEAKRQSEPPPVHLLQPWAPYALDQLCAELLRRDPAARPKSTQVLERLQVHTLVRETPTPQPTSELFIGRASEMAMLGQAFADCQRGEGVTLLVHGESGVGKSALVRHFLEDAVRRRSVVVLAGRCYERESVPYKAIDAVIDRLALHLGRLGPEVVQALLPPNFPLLAQLFPVLMPLCEAGTEALRVVDPVEMRQLAFAALRELLSRLAKRTPLILVIDDLQWADVDSFVLLGELLRTPRPPFLLIGTVRTKTSSLNPTGTLAKLTELPGEIRNLSIEKLPETDAHSLVAQLLKQLSLSGDVDEAASEIVREANGHPLFIDELVRLRKSHSEKAPLRLDEALWQRVQRLPGPARNLIEVVAVAGVPIAQELAAQASAIDLSHFDGQVSLLRAARLLRTSGPRRSDTIEPYHDRVRESIQSRLSDRVRRSWHGRLAVAIESAEVPDPEALLLHWEAAGHPDRAATYAVQAAERAAAALAFERAARLYEQALKLSQAVGERRRELLIRLSEALINQGLGPAGAALLIQAAEGADPVRASTLRRQASDHYLRSGRFDEGVGLMKQALQDLGLMFPSSTVLALGSLMLHQLRLSVRGLKFTQRDASQVPQVELNIIDTLRACAIAFGSLDPMRGTEITLRMVLRALRSGEPGRVATALTQTALTFGVQGTPETFREGQELLAKARELVAPLPDPYPMAFIMQNDGMIHHVCGRWRRCGQLLEEADRTLRERCTGVHWELALLRSLAVSNHYYRGELQRVVTLTPQFLEDAERRGDMFFLVYVASTSLSISHLIQDRPQLARTETARRLACWTYPGPALHKFNALCWSVQSHLYEGLGSLAYQRWSAEPLTAYRLMGRQAQIVRMMLSDLTGRTALMAATEHSGAERESLLRKVEQSAAALAREWSTWGLPQAQALRAGALAVRGQTQAARATLAESASGFDGADMPLHAAAVRHRSALLLGGPEGQRLADEAEAALRALGLVNPTAWTQMLVPDPRA